MDRISLELEDRQNVGGRKVKRLRKSGYIPAVVYGRDITSQAVQVKSKEFRNLLSKHGSNCIFTTEFAAEQDFSVLVKDVQYDVYNYEILNVDFQKVSPEQKVNAKVPVRTHGWESLESEGFVIVHQLNTVTVECLPGNIPQYLEADVSKLTPGHSLTASQLKIPQDVTLVTDPKDIILSITNGRLEIKERGTDEPVTPIGEEGNVFAKHV